MRSLKDLGSLLARGATGLGEGALVLQQTVSGGLSSAGEFLSSRKDLFVKSLSVGMSSHYYTKKTPKELLASFQDAAKKFQLQLVLLREYLQDQDMLMHIGKLEKSVSAIDAAILMYNAGEQPSLVLLVAELEKQLELLHAYTSTEFKPLLIVFIGLAERYLIQLKPAPIDDTLEGTQLVRICESSPAQAEPESVLAPAPETEILPKRLTIPLITIRDSVQKMLKTSEPRLGKFHTKRSKKLQPLRPVLLKMHEQIKLLFTLSEQEVLWALPNLFTFLKEAHVNLKALLQGNEDVTFQKILYGFRRTLRHNELTLRQSTAPETETSAPQDTVAEYPIYITLPHDSPIGYAIVSSSIGSKQYFVEPTTLPQIISKFSLAPIKSSGWIHLSTQGFYQFIQAMIEHQQSITEYQLIGAQQCNH